MKSSNKGFTLVELSIVIVIIGLIIAGVTAGQVLVKQTQLRSIITQADQIKASVNAFKLQYMGLPGDITNGYSYWTGCTSTAACNGNGNKQIETALKAANTSSEAYVAWWQLNAAGVYPGSFTTPNTAGMTIVGTIGATIPAGKYSGSGITLGYDGGLLSSTASMSKNIILFGAAHASSLSDTAFLTPVQVSSIEIKVDDSNALKGNVYGGVTGGSASALTACASAAGVYAISTSPQTATCTIGFSLQ